MDDEERGWRKAGDGRRATGGGRRTTGGGDGDEREIFFSETTFWCQRSAPRAYLCLKLSTNFLLLILSST